jgi:hypothetical protein
MINRISSRKKSRKNEQITDISLDNDSYESLRCGRVPERWGLETGDILVCGRFVKLVNFILGQNNAY